MLVGTLNCRPAFVDILPRVAVTNHRWKQAWIVLGVRVHAAAIGRVGTRCITCTDPLFHQGATVLASPATAVVAIVFHGQALLANGCARRRNRDIVLVLFVTRLALVQINERDDAFGLEVAVKGHGIVGSIE